jgi:tRNA (Thr-GGU) A37 N-methylase
LRVQGLDAIDGTPVIDIKPYIPDYDSAKDATVPDWIVREEK